MGKMIDLVDIKRAVNKGLIRFELIGNSIYCVDKENGERCIVCKLDSKGEQP